MVCRISALAVCFALSGCASSQEQRVELSRFDGAPLVLATEEQARTECAARAQVARDGVPRLSGDTYGIGRSVEQAKVQQAAFKGCMAEKGIRIEWVQDAGPTETAAET
jgi:hypothetical protein